MEIMQEISSLIRAKYPLIYINSQEEVRVVNLLKTIISWTNLDIVEWSFASGLTGENIKEKKMHAGDPVSVLEHYKIVDQDTAIVLKDYHAFLKDAEVIRALKDAVNDYRGGYCPIIIVSPVVNIPVEIEKETVLVDFPLPDRDYIRKVLEDIVETSGLVADEERINRSIDACTGLTHAEIENIASKSIIVEDTINPDYILQEKKAIVKKSGILEYIEAEETLDKVGGTAKLKHWLRQRQVSFSSEAREYGLPIPKGLMLTGVPGCGKSMVCKALSNSWNMPLLKLDVGKVMGSLVGSSEENMRKVIKIAESVAPCVLWVK